MTPLWIELEGIRSFVTRRRIEFTDLGLFAILGDTGAGKSSILEAMVYALFNATTWSGRDVKELMTIGAARMRVQLSFTLGGRTYTVSRSTPRELGPSNHLLACAQDPEERREGEGPVGRRIEELLGLDRETFTKTVVLPQGEFAALLTLAPAKRTKLLTDILGLGILDDMITGLAGPRERATALRAQLKGERSRLPTDPSASVAAAEKALSDARKRHRSLEAALQNQKQRQTVLDDLQRVMSDRAEDRARLEMAPAALTRLESLVGADEKLRQEKAEAEARRLSAEDALRRANAQLEERSREGRDTPTLRAVHEVLGRLIEARAERRREADVLARRRANVQAAESGRSAALSHLADAERERNSAYRPCEGTKTNLTVANAALQTAERAFERLTAARTSFAEAAKHVEGAHEAVQRAIAAYEHAQSDDRGAAEVLSNAQKTLEYVQRARSAAHAAQGLGPGDPCPICERVLPGGFSPQAAPDLDRCQRDAEAARKRALAAHAALARAETARDNALRARDEAIADHTACRSVLDMATVEARAAGLETTSADAGTALESLRGRTAECQNAAERAAKTLEEKANTVAAATAKHVAAVDACELAKGELTACQDQIAHRDESIATLRERLPAAYRPSEDADGDPPVALRASVGDALEEVSGLEQSRTNAAIAVTAATDMLRALDARHVRDVAAPQRTACTELAGVVSVLERIGSAPHGIVSPAPDATLHDVLGWARAVARGGEAAICHLVADDEHDLQCRNEAAAAITALLCEHGVSSPKALSDRRDEALQAVAVAENSVGAAEVAARDAAALDERLGNLDPFARALDALHGALGDAKFKQFVAARKEEQLLGVATTVLRGMTGDRYGFAKGLRIVDRRAGQERSPQTLSGGEKFLASLALALALVEIAARSGGRFGALFLDEGFGTLDPHALDEALSELERQASAGRMIGVITHVREVTEYIDDVLRVSKTASGSDVRRLDRAELDVLAEETASASVIGLQMAAER